MPAKKGNKNALKHGFYSQLLSREEIARLSKIHDIDLDDEIKLLRTIVHRLREKITLRELKEDELKALNTLANIVQVINTTQRTKLLARGSGEIADTIFTALVTLDPYKDL